MLGLHVAIPQYRERVANNGNPLTRESLANLFAKALRAADVQKSAHGLRKGGNAANHRAEINWRLCIFSNQLAPFGQAAVVRLAGFMLCGGKAGRQV